MDHDQCRKRIGQLKDELDYNISRKEELKKEVRKLKDQYEQINGKWKLNAASTHPLNPCALLPHIH